MVETSARLDRLEAVRRRRDSISRRLAELTAQAAVPARPAAGDLAQIRRRALQSQLAARRALLAYRDALYRSAQAHDRAAAAHQRAARITGDAAAHEQMTAFHRAAAAADRHRAGQIGV